MFFLKRQIPDDSYGSSDPDYGFQIPVPDPGLSMFVWQRAENDKQWT